jgi:hypothetical protein
MEALSVVRRPGSPYLLDSLLTDDSEVVSLIRRPSFTRRKIPGTHFCLRLSQLLGHSAAGRIRSIEKSNDLIESRTATCLFPLVWCITICFGRVRDYPLHFLSSVSMLFLLGLEKSHILRPLLHGPFVPLLSSLRMAETEMRSTAS